MPDKPASERTEEATPHRLHKARQEGKIPQSQEVPTALMLLALLVTLILAGPALLEWMLIEVRGGLGFRYDGALGLEGWAHRMSERGKETLFAIGPFLAVGAATSIFASSLVGGWVVSPKALKLDFGRINPIRGIRNLFSLKALVRLLVSVVKLVLVGTLIWLYVRERMGMFLALSNTSPMEAVCGMADLVRGLLLRVALAMAVVALFDLIYQRWNYKKELRMTKQELKEEFKQYEINPHVKGRIRTIQREMARKRMLNAVPSADVVVTNPTHFAVALKYDSDTMDAPHVIGKGADLLAQQIRRIAKDHDVPVVERPQLARTLYATTEVGQAIPETLFVAVAELLAMIYRMRKQSAAS